MTDRLTLQINIENQCHDQRVETAAPTQPGIAGRKAIVSKRVNLSSEEREALIIDVTVHMLKGTMTKGEALKTLRLKLFSVNQTDFANMAGVSRKALSEIENGKGNYTEAFLQKIFFPLGMVSTVIPRDLTILDKARAVC